MNTVTVLNYPVLAEPICKILETLEAGISQGQHQHVVTLNPEMLMAGEKNLSFGNILKSAEIILPDGVGIIWALSRKKQTVKRVPGIEFSEALLAKAAQNKEAVALIGAAHDVNTETVSQLQKRYPGLNIVYAHHGFFESSEDRVAVAEACASSHPQYVFVALGVPGQEFWITEFKPLFKVPTVFVGVGGSFDVWSGLKKRAPEIFLKFNLEWLYRITSEPWRLKRVGVTLPMFVINVLLRDNK